MAPLDRIRWARDMPVISAAERVILLVLASHSDPGGTCWPSLATIARESCLSRATVKRAMATLERGGLVTGERMPKPQSTRYHLRLWGPE